MSDLSSYLSTRNKQWSAKLWDGFIEAVQARLAPLEEQLDIQKEVADAIVARGLTVIEQELAPIVAQADQILDESTASINAKLARFEQKVTGGTVISMSNSSATLANGATLNLTIVPADREFFAPTPFLAISRASTVANWAIAKVNSFNRTTGALSITLEQVNGAGGPYTDWIITSLPGATLLQKDYYEKTLALRAQVADDKVKTGEDRAAALAHKNDASDAAALSVAARNGSAQAFADMRKAIAVPLVPPTAPEIGQIWWDGNVVRVYDGVGFVPTVTASIGGLRFDEGSFPAGTDGVITIAGGFRFVMIWLNGALLYESRGDFVSATPDITIPSATEGDEWKYWAYQAIDATDYDTKEQVNEKIVTALVPVAAALGKRVQFDAAQTLTQTEKGQALANVGAGILAGWRNKLINGAFIINIRGTITIPAGGYAITADRFKVFNNTNQPCTVATSSDGRDRLQFIFNTAPTSGGVSFEQQIEDVRSVSDLFVSKLYTFTFDVFYSASDTAVLQPYVIQKFGATGASPNVPVAVAPDVMLPARKRRMIELPPTSGKTITAGSSVIVGLTFSPRASGYYEFARFSFVEGNATKEDDPFSPRNVQEELMLCQRYSRLMPLGTIGRAVSETNIAFFYTMLPAMRGNPSAALAGSGNLVCDNGTHSTSASPPSIGGGVLTASGVRIFVEGFSALQVGVMWALTTGRTILLDAEL